jgi:hypothetical protein
VQPLQGCSGRILRPPAEWRPARRNVISALLAARAAAKLPLLAMRPVTINVNDFPSALREIQTASHENDIVEIAQNLNWRRMGRGAFLSVGVLTQRTSGCRGSALGPPNDGRATKGCRPPIPQGHLSRRDDDLSVLDRRPWPEPCIAQSA